MSVTYRISVRCLDFRNKVNGEYFTVSYMSKVLPANLAMALQTAKEMGEIALSVYEMSEPVGIKFERYWL